MKSKGGILLRHLLLATSDINTLRYETDAKRRTRAIQTIAIKVVLFFILTGYSLMTAVTYGILEMSYVIPAINGLLMCMLALMIGFLESKGYLLAGSDYELLLSLPISVRQIVQTRFWFMYCKELPWYVGISAALGVAYILFSGASILIFPLWMIASLVLIVIPLWIATYIVAIISGISVHFKHKTLVEVILSFALMFFFIISTSNLSADGDKEITLETIGNLGHQVVGMVQVFWPIRWFYQTVTEGNLLGLFILILSTIVAMLLFAQALALVYEKLHIHLESEDSHKAYVLTEQKQKSITGAIVKQEVLRFFSSSIYVVNMGAGLIMILAVAVGIWFVDREKILAQLFAKIPFTMDMATILFPVIVGAMVGMCMTTAVSPSLQGKTYWILQTMPVSPKQICVGRILFNLLLQVPVAFIATCSLCLAFRVTVMQSILSLMVVVLLCVATSVAGMIPGEWFIKLEWENEAEVIKQGAAMLVGTLFDLFFMVLVAVISVFATKILGYLSATILQLVIIVAVTAGMWGILQKILQRKY